MQDLDFERLDYYALLGVPRNATADEIKRAYRQQIMRYHPDRYMNAPADVQEYARQRSLRINEAYATLSDFGSRSAYVRGGYGGQRPTVQTSPKPATPPPPRDHQAELYEQARTHIEGGRFVQALAALRQLQQVNPFYRDTAALIAMVDAQLHPEEPPRAAPVSGPRTGTSQRTRRWILGGAIGSAAIAAAVAAVVGLRGQASRIWAGRPQVTAAPSEAVVAVQPTAEPTSAASFVPTIAPTQAPTTAPSPSPIPASPTDIPTPATTDTPVPPTPVQEQGQQLIADNFSQGGWANQQGPTWSVGYLRGAYRIIANPGSGNIWSYRTIPDTSNYSLGVDVRADTGSVGVLVRYQDRSNYVVCLIAPADGRYRVEQHVRGQTIVIDQGQNSAIITTSGATNRVVARVNDTQLTMLVNGTQVVNATVRGIPQTQQYGIVATAADVPIEALFDNLEVRTLP